MKLSDLGKSEITIRNPVAGSQERLSANLITPFTRHGYTVVMCLGMSTEFGVDTRLFVFGKQLSLSTSQLVCEPLSSDEQRQLQVDLAEILAEAVGQRSIYFDGTIAPGPDTFDCAQFLGLPGDERDLILAASD